MSDAAQDRRPECVERWPECESGAYDPRCCRFPKSCSCNVRPEESAAYVDLLAAAKRVTRAYTAEAEDWNGGEFALWRKDDLVVALVELRKLVGDG